MDQQLNPTQPNTNSGQAQPIQSNQPTEPAPMPQANPVGEPARNDYVNNGAGGTMAYGAQPINPQPASVPVAEPAQMQAAPEAPISQPQAVPELTSAKVETVSYGAQPIQPETQADPVKPAVVQSQDTSSSDNITIETMNMDDDSGEIIKGVPSAIEIANNSSSNKVFLIVGIIVGALVLIFGVYFAFSYFTKSSDQNAVNSQNKTAPIEMNSTNQSANNNQNTAPSIDQKISSIEADLNGMNVDGFENDINNSVKDVENSLQ